MEQSSLFLSKEHAVRTRLSLCLAVPALLVGLTVLPGLAEQQGKSDSREGAVIQKQAEAFIAAFEKGDAKALAAFWTPDGDYTDQTGNRLVGREAIEKSFAELFSETKGL